MIVETASASRTLRSVGRTLWLSGFRGLKWEKLTDDGHPSYGNSSHDLSSS